MEHGVMEQGEQAAGLIGLVVDGCSWLVKAPGTR